MSSVEQALASLGAVLAAKKPEPEQPPQPAKVVQLQIKFHPDPSRTAFFRGRVPRPGPPIFRRPGLFRI
jgi:hypothetical protein